MNNSITGRPLYIEDKTDISIQRVGNGWIVVMPQRMPDMPNEFAPMWDKINDLTNKLYKSKDPILDKIDEEQKQPEDAPFVERVPVMENIFIFDDFDKLLLFLKHEVNN